jgi:hypothetical protein
MRKLLIVAAIVLTAASSACAKINVTVKVAISDEKIRQELLEALEARINSTERYAISSKEFETDILLSVNCLVLEQGTRTRSVFVCDSDVTYYPYKNEAISVGIEAAESIVAAGIDDPSYVANYLMNHFINGTTDATLADRKGFLRTAIRLLCAHNHAECSMPRP